jgi:heat shock protein HslJ
MIQNKKIRIILLATILIGTLSGCLESRNNLTGTAWEVATLNGEELISNTSITLEFSDEHLGGQMDCNGYGGTPDTGGYQVANKGEFSLGELLAVTVQLCSEPEGIMEQEKAYIQALMSVIHYRVSADHLEMENELGEIILVFKK